MAIRLGFVETQRYFV